MRFMVLLAVAVLLFPATGPGAAQDASSTPDPTVPFHRGVTIRFVNASEGAAFLGAADDWVAEFSPMDLQLRLRSTEDATVPRFLEYAASQALDWTAEEVASFGAVVTEVNARLDSLELALDLPDEILLIKTTGHEEGDAGGYTRANAIIVPEGTADSKKPAGFFLHELFHVMSRHNPEIRTPLYGHIGFEYGGPLAAYPESLVPRKLTNPDAYHHAYYITLTVGGDEVPLVPLTLSHDAEYKSGGVAENVTFEFLKAAVGPKGMEAVLDEEGAPVLYGLGETQGYITRIGQNTMYFIHPEEILADNFSFAVLGKKGLPSPEITEAILKTLRRGE